MQHPFVFKLIYPAFQAPTFRESAPDSVNDDLLPLPAANDDSMSVCSDDLPPEQFLIAADGLVFDQVTGEILGYDDKPSAFSIPAEYIPPLSECRSVDDYERHLSFVDRRKLPPHTLHSLHDEVDHCHGKWRQTGLDCRISLAQVRLLEKLHGLVLYRNVIFMKQADLAMALGTAESNLMKKLKVLIDTNMLRVTTSRNGNIRVGEIKLAVNPRLIFRGSECRRENYIKSWYLPLGTPSSKLEWAMKMGDLLAGAE